MNSRPGARWPRAILIAIHVPVVVVPAFFTVLAIRGDITVSDVLPPAVIAGLIGGLQLRHSLAAARGERPRGALWTLLALAVLVYAPLYWFGLNWGITQTALIASFLMLLPGRASLVGVAAVLLTATAYATSLKWGNGSFGKVVYDVGGAVVFDAVVGVALYGAARLVRVHDELESARTELAELAVGRERLRVSRDLHDLLGQSLSAVSLKGDLAIRLLHDDPGAARAEIESLTGVARDALRGVRAITLEEHRVSLRTETDGAAALLDAAGVRTRLDIQLPPLPAPAEEVLAWAVREGVTNVLRHSQASTCAIRAGRRGDRTWLEIVNDGSPAGVHSGSGNGLAGLAGRAEALSGSVTASADGGTFRLLVEIPSEPR